MILTKQTISAQFRVINHKDENNVVLSVRLFLCPLFKLSYNTCVSCHIAGSPPTVTTSHVCDIAVTSADVRAVSRSVTRNCPTVTTSVRPSVTRLYWPRYRRRSVGPDGLVISLLVVEYIFLIISIICLLQNQCSLNNMHEWIILLTESEISEVCCTWYLLKIFMFL